MPANLSLQPFHCYNDLAEFTGSSYCAQQHGHYDLDTTNFCYFFNSVAHLRTEYVVDGDDLLDHYQGLHDCFPKPRTAEKFVVG